MIQQSTTAVHAQSYCLRIGQPLLSMGWTKRNLLQNFNSVLLTTIRKEQSFVSYLCCLCIRRVNQLVKVMIIESYGLSSPTVCPSLIVCLTYVKTDHQPLVYQQTDHQPLVYQQTDHQPLVYQQTDHQPLIYHILIISLLYITY